MADQVQNQQNNSISGFTDNDIVIVMNRAFTETQENRTKALDVYDSLVKKMGENDGNLAIMGTYAQSYLDVATKQTSELVKLAGVMQRLKATKIVGDNPGAFDTKQIFSQVVNYLEDKNVIPYQNIEDKDMNYKRNPNEKEIIVQDTKILVKQEPINSNNVLQTKTQLLGLSDINVDELEQEI